MRIAVIMAAVLAVGVPGYRSANRIQEDRWQVPIADEKWTPSQITQHVTKTYEAMIHQLRTGEGLQVQTGWFVRQVLRQAVLRPIMWTRKLPKGAKAPRMLRPDDSGLGRDEAVERLQGVVTEFVDELDARRGAVRIGRSRR